MAHDDSNVTRVIYHGVSTMVLGQKGVPINQKEKPVTLAKESKPTGKKPG